VIETTPIETLLRRDRWIVTGVLAVTVLICWAWIVPMGRDMYGTMMGPSAWMMTNRWDASYIGLIFAMWVVMMAGMMLPSAAPVLLLYARVIRKSPAGERTQVHVHAFAAGYVVVWTGFSLLATFLQWGLTRQAWMTPMMESSGDRVTAVIFVLAGIYQLTPWKRTCLNACRSPVEFLSRHWKAGPAGGFTLGVVNGMYCLGCCWAIMLLLFAGGVMNLWWIFGITIFVLLEKVVPHGRLFSRATGGLLMFAGLWLIVQG
jgi:predicted metal-binding membrane protein